MAEIEKMPPAKCGHCGCTLDEYNMLVGETLCNSCQREQARVESVRASIEEHVHAAGVGRRHQHLKIDSFPRPTKMRKAISRLLAGEVTGLFLHGVPGCGKTSLAAGLVRELLWRGETARMVVVPRLLQALRVATWNNRVDEQELLERYSKAPVLVLDDLGAEEKNDRTMDRLYLVVNDRYQECRTTVITSNLSIPEISEKLHARLASRIAEMCVKVEFPAKDYRVEG